MSRLLHKKALVFGDDTRSFLSVIRSLSNAGMIVDVVTFDNMSPALLSKHIRRIFNYNHQSISLIDWSLKVSTLIAKDEYDLVVPCDERALFPLLDIQDRNICHSIFALPKRKDIAPLFDKNETRSLAQSLNIPTAGGKLIQLKDYSYSKLITEFGDKTVLKPLQSFDDDNLDKRNNVAIIINEPQYNKFKKYAAATILAERYFSGKGVGVSVLSDQGDIKRAFSHARVAEPLTGGGSSYRKSIPLDSDMLMACQAICQKLQYTGVAMFEFKQNMSSKEWVLIEINARFWGSLPLAIFSGVDFPKDYARLLFGETLSKDLSYKNHVFARQFSTDIYAIKEDFDNYLSQGKTKKAFISLLQRFSSFSRLLIAKEKIDSFSLNDQRPFYNEVKQLFGSSLRQLLVFKLFKSEKSSSPLANINLAELNEIIFVCYGNIMRSPFAEHYFKKNIYKIDDVDISVRSSGFHLKEQRSSPSVAIASAKKFNVDLNEHQSHWLSQKDIHRSKQLIIVFDEYNKDKLSRYYKQANVLCLAELIPEQIGVFRHIKDPYGKNQKTVEKCYRLIAAGIDELIHNIDCSKQPSTPSPSLKVDVRKESNINVLQALWKSIEVKANNSFFTSWHWIGTWFQQLEKKPMLLTVTENEQVIGLGFIKINRNRKFIFNVRQMWLNRTGERKEDQIWIEYNDFLSIAGREKEVRQAALNHLYHQNQSIDEILLGACEHGTFSCSVPSSINVSAHWDDISYQRKLKPNYENIDEYLAVLSSNTRYQIRKSLKHYKAQGDLRFEFAQTKEEALEFFSLTAEHHINKWKQESGFLNDFFIGFHQRMIKDNFDHKVIDFIKISVNQKPISFLYNFYYKKHVYFYLSGIDYSSIEAKEKPGLVSHSLAISEYARQGALVYDFMGGEGQYKASLCDQQSLLQITSIRKPRTKFLLLKKGKNLLKLFR